MAVSTIGSAGLDQAANTTFCTTSGNVGIGTASPSQKLEVAGNVLLSNNQYFGVKDTTGAAVGFPIYTGSNDAIFGYLASGTTGISTYQFRTGNNVERMRIDSSGNVGVGTTTPLNFGGANLQVQNSTIGSVVWSNGTYIGQLLASAAAEVTIGSRSNHPLRLSTNDTERMRIDAGGTVYINTTTDNTAFLNINHEGTTRYAISCNNTNTGASSQIAIRFNRGTSYTQVGTITTTNAATSYASGSDYRLKDNIQPMTGALAKVALLKPVTFNWTIDGSDGQGFIAHELQEVCPDAVTGSKDAVDENGKPEYQGVDTSFLVATLTAAIQELTARIEALESK